jgi:hypothetical protein
VNGWGQRFIVVRGLGEERPHLAALLARALPGPVAHIQGDDLARRWIVQGLLDTAREVETVYRIMRLVTVSYLKEGYNVVLDAPFAARIGDETELRTSDLRDLTRLARTFRAITTGVVTLQGTGMPRTLLDAIGRDEIEGEVLVRPDLLADEARTVQGILDRLGM